MKETSTNSYKESFKATSLFGGVEFFNILISIVRSKFAAVLLGPEGMGIMGLLNSTITLISSLTNCGLRSSAVRNVAEANASADTRRVASTIGVLRRLVWVTGILGSLICLIFSQYWSRLTFGNTEYTYAFILLSCSILFMQLTSGENVLLQGLQKYKYLAKASVLGNLSGLIITVPLYYFFRLDAIIPVLILVNLLTFLFARRFSRKIVIEHEHPITKTEVKTIGGSMVKMGVLISLQGLLASLAGYLIKIYIGRYGTLADVGLFNAGFTLVNTYVGVVLTAMATDYYPRLSRLNAQPIEFKKTINQQIEIALLLLTPIIIAFIIYIKWVVVLLYSSKFLPIEAMLYWVISAMLFKAISWSLSYSLLAKGDSKAFFWNESTTLVYGLALNVLGYYLYGLTGLGISSLIKYFLYFMQLWLLTRYRYGFRFTPIVIKIFTIALAIVMSVLAIKIYTSELISYTVGTAIFLAVSWFAFVELDRRINLKQMITNRIRTKNS